MYFKKLLFSEGLVVVLIKLLGLPKNEEYRLVLDQVIILIGTLASYNPESRDYLLDSGVLIHLLELFSSQQEMIPHSRLRALSWTLSILLGVTHSPSNLPKWEQVKISFQVIIQMFLLINDEDIIRNLLVALSLALPGLPPETSVCRRFIELLTVIDAVNMVELTLITLTELLQYDEPGEVANNNLSILLQLGLMNQIKTLARAKENAIRISVANLCAVIAEKSKD